MTKTYDLYELLTTEELEKITEIFLDALARSKGIDPEIFEIETKIIID